MIKHDNTDLLIKCIYKFVKKHSLRKIQYINIYRYTNKKSLTIFVIYSQTQSVKEKITLNFLTTMLMWKWHKVYIQILKKGQMINNNINVLNQSFDKNCEWTDLKILGAKYNDNILIQSKGNDPILISCK
jgi:hypothetical protein